MSLDCLREYESFLRGLLREGYSVWSFDRFIDAPKDSLPERLAVLRHDIHYRDIEGGYRMLEIEGSLEDVSSTSFVQYGFIPIREEERRWETRSDWQEAYAEYIEYCLKRGIDAQAHISPYSMCFDGSEPFLGPDSERLFSELFKDNYEPGFAFDDSGRRIARELKVTGRDSLGLINALKRVKAGLIEYATDWKAKFGSSVSGYSAHGESSINSIVKYDANSFLDQLALVESDLYRYTANGMSVINWLGYFSDSYDKPEDLGSFGHKTNKVDPSKGERFQILVHPAQWYRA